ncbi:hypothetical protein AVEN_252313-1, partial [Araneus ventricosus]
MKCALIFNTCNRPTYTADLQWNRVSGLGEVTIPPVLNRTVPILGSLSRCPRTNLRDAEMSRFQELGTKRLETETQ